MYVKKRAGVCVSVCISVLWLCECLLPLLLSTVTLCLDNVSLLLPLPLHVTAIWVHVWVLTNKSIFEYFGVGTTSESREHTPLSLKDTHTSL